MIAAGPNTWIGNRVLATEMLVAVGLISYPLYLWHWPLLSFIRIVNGNGAIRGRCYTCNPAQLRTGLADLFTRGETATFRQIGANESLHIVCCDGNDRLCGVCHLCKQWV